MKREALLSLLLALFGGGCSTTPGDRPQRFTLQALYQPIIGPVCFQHGQKLRIGDKEYVIVKDEPERREIEAMLASVIVPSVTFREAEIGDVLEFISEGCRPAPPEINIVLRSKPDGIPKITMSFQRVSALHILKTACEIAHLKFDVKQGVVIVETQ